MFLFLISSCGFGESTFDSETFFELSFGRSVHDFTVESIEGLNIPLSLFEGDVLLIVNVASECGLTYQYQGLEYMREKYRHFGFEVLAFPSNQFGNQEPGTNEEIQEFCRNVMNVTFPLFARIDVTGENQSLLFRFLVNNAPYNKTDEEIEWNFAKFLIDREGNIYRRYHPQVEPEDLSADIEYLLGIDV